MSIQSNINQGLGIGTALLSQTGLAAATKEKVAAKRELKSIDKTQKTLSELKPSSGEEATHGDIQQADSLTGILQRKYQLALKTGNIQAAQDAIGLMDEMEDVNASYANMRAQTKVKDRQRQKQNIQAYIHSASSDYMKLLKEDKNANN